MVVTELSTKPIASEIEQELSNRTYDLGMHDPRVVPSLALITDYPKHPATERYMELKSKIGARVGVVVVSDQLVPGSIDNVLNTIEQRNFEEKIDGIIVQLPLYINTDENVDRVVSTIRPCKDVDGLGPRAGYPSATSSAVMEILRYYDTGYVDNEVAVFGRGRLVGGPLLELLAKDGAKKVTSVDRNTPAEERLAVLNRAPIIVTGMGVPEVITPDLFDDMEQPRVVIDAGTAEQSGEMFGDVSDELRDEAVKYGWQITPKKGWGVGSLTVRTLLSHVVDSAEQRAESL